MFYSIQHNKTKKQLFCITKKEGKKTKQGQTIDIISLLFYMYESQLEVHRVLLLRSMIVERDVTRETFVQWIVLDYLERNVPKLAKK